MSPERAPRPDPPPAARDADDEAVAALDAALADLDDTGAEALHLEPGRHAHRLRLRVDGRFRPAGAAPTLPPVPARALVARLKTLARLDPHERRLPQEGTLVRRDPDARGGERRYEVLTLPVVGGESVVVRPLEPAARRTLDDLVQDPLDRARLAAAVDARRGLVLVVGPSSAGKRTLVRACLARLGATGDRGVVAIERAARHRGELPGVAQVALDDGQGWSTGEALRRALRVGADAVGLCDALHAPDEAALLVRQGATRLGLGAVYGREAACGPLRLLDLGLEPSLLARAVTLAAAVRLVPRLCPECKAPTRPPSDAELRRLAPRLQGDRARRGPACAPRGCGACDGSGRRGRALVTEVLPLGGDPSTSPLLDGGCLRERLQAGVRRTLREAAVALALEGVVALEDALLATEDGP